MIKFKKITRSIGFHLTITTVLGGLTYTIGVGPLFEDTLK